MADAQVTTELSNLTAEEDTGRVSGLSEYYKKSGKSRQKVVLEWKNLNYNVVIKDPITGKYVQKTILDNVSGVAESGQLLAVMGPTGCGKTSLLNILAAKLPAGASEYQSLQGEIYVNGKLRNDEKFRRISSYVLQDDFMYPHLTVLEVLTLASHFYCPASMNDEQKAELVTATIMELGLVKAKDTLIGDDKVRGVSGGERKRTNIAVQLITDPAVLFLDEPTSGLDSFQALAVMECIKGLANNGRLVISVIHQPRSQIFSMFDRMLLLSTGRDIYFGTASGALDYFKKLEYSCPDDFNPADFYLDILSPDNRTKELENNSSARIVSFAESWSQNESKAAMMACNLSQDAKLEGGELLKESEIEEIGQDASCASFLMQLKHLSWRTYTEVKRDWITLLIGTVIFALMGLLVGGVYSNIGFSQISIQNRNGCLFFMGVNCAFNGLFAVLNVFPKEKNIVNTERANRAYGIVPYFLAKFFVEIPVRIAPAIIYGSILYWLVGLNPDRYPQCIGILMSVQLATVTLGLFISSAMPTLEAANGVGPLIVVVMILFGGFYIDVDSLPEVANLVPYISIMRWSFQSLTINEYKGLVFECEAGKKCLKTGEQVLDSLGFGGKDLSYPVGGLYALIAGFFVLAFIVLWRSKATYSPLNFVGSKYAMLTGASDKKDVPSKGFWRSLFKYDSEHEFFNWGPLHHVKREVEMTKVATEDTEGAAPDMGTIYASDKEMIDSPSIDTRNLVIPQKMLE